jgi:hypothetical protein
MNVPVHKRTGQKGTGPLGKSEVSTLKKPAPKLPGWCALA